MSEMRIRMQCADQKSGIAIANVDLAFTGGAVDGRGKAAHAALVGSAARTIRLQYDSEYLQLQCDSELVECDAVAEWLAMRQPQSIVLEATTLGFPEIVLCCRAAKAVGLAQISFLY